MSPDRALQKAVFEALLAASDVTDLVSTRIYDGPPKGVVHPYISFGPASALDGDGDLLDGSEMILQIDVWCEDQGRDGPCKDICHAVKVALHRVNLTIDDPYAVSSERVVQYRVIPEPDEIGSHGIVDFRAFVEG
ncbi:MAG: hypothetical protein CML68_13465 [Rhodobacteraceae bacterium]|nr:hypothetical protein [Paracoccaceae bacterium]